MGAGHDWPARGDSSTAGTSREAGGSKRVTVCWMCRPRSFGANHERPFMCIEVPSPKRSNDGRKSVMTNSPAHWSVAGVRARRDAGGISSAAAPRHANTGRQSYAQPARRPTCRPRYYDLSAAGHLLREVERGWGACRSRFEDGSPLGGPSRGISSNGPRVAPPSPWPGSDNARERRLSTYGRQHERREGVLASSLPKG